MNICRDILISSQGGGRIDSVPENQTFFTSNEDFGTPNGSRDTILSFCLLQQDVLFPSLLILLFSSIFCSVVNGILNAIDTSVLSYFRSVIQRRQQLLEATKEVQRRAESPIRHSIDGAVSETTYLLPPSSSPAFNPSPAMSWWNSQSPFKSGEDSAVYVDTGNSMELSFASSQVYLALEISLHGVRMAAQKCFFTLSPTYMMISITKCYLMVVFIQYHFDSIPGGWRRFCVCGAANVLSATFTPLYEFLNSFILPIDVHPELEEGNKKINSKKMNNSNEKEEEEKDSVLIVEILVRIGQVQLTDLTTVFIQGSLFVLLSAVFLPTFLVFGTIGGLFSWMLFFVIGAYYFLWKSYHTKSCPFLPHFLRNIRHPLGVIVTELAAAGGLKILTLFLVQLCVVVSFMMGVAILDGLSYYHSMQFVFHQLFRWRLWTTSEVSWFQWLTLCSQLFF